MSAKVPVYIMAGGQSRRFGSDKALADMNGQPMIARVARQWRPWALRIVAVADRADKYAACGLATIADHHPGQGPMAGLTRAMEDCGGAAGGWLLMAACDAMVLDPKLPKLLFAEVSQPVQVIALKGEHWQTMPALYHCSLLPALQASMAQGQLAVWRVIEQVPHKAIVVAGGDQMVAQINTREEFAAYEARTIRGTRPTP